MRTPDRVAVQVLKDEIFRGDVLLVVGAVPLFIPWVRKRYDEPLFDLNHHAALGRVVYHDWSGGAREWLVHFPTLTPRPDSIVHECVHLGLDILGHRGIMFSKGGDADETLCYYVESMFRQISDTLVRWRKQGR